MGGQTLSAVQYKQARRARGTPSHSSFACLSTSKRRPLAALLWPLPTPPPSPTPPSLVRGPAAPQMAGRAGRAGLETSGEVFAISNNARDQAEIAGLMNSSMPPVVSQLMSPLAPSAQAGAAEGGAADVGSGDAIGAQCVPPVAGPSGQPWGGQLPTVQGDGLAMLLLEVISLGLVQCPEDVRLLLRSSLWALQQKDKGAVSIAAQRALKTLGEKQLIKWQAPRLTSNHIPLCRPLHSPPETSAPSRS